MPIYGPQQVSLERKIASATDETQGYSKVTINFRGKKMVKLTYLALWNTSRGWTNNQTGHQLGDELIVLVQGIQQGKGNELNVIQKTFNPPLEIETEYLYFQWAQVKENDSLRYSYIYQVQKG